MAQKRRRKVKESEVTGTKYLRKLLPLLERLHDDGCERDKAGNHRLHFDQYCTLILLYLFNPVVVSLRSLQQASELQKVQKLLGCKRASLGSLSEAVTVFDPERLKEIIAELGTELVPLGRDPRLQDVPGLLTVVDGTLLSALPKMMEASLRKGKTGTGMVKWRLHTHFEVDRSVPVRVDVTRKAGGEADERAVLKRCIESDRTSVLDRGYAMFSLFNQIVAAKSSYVCRIRDNSGFDGIESRELTEQDLAAGVLRDHIVSIGKSCTGENRPSHPIRVVEVQTTPHVKRGKYRGGSTGPGSNGILRIATNLLDVPAETIAVLHEHRWTIEIFFRFFKHVLGCRHLLSHDERGIEIQTYCAIIACMLISLWTGRKPSLRTYEMICYYFSGLASEEELLAHSAKLPQQPPDS